jgi:hemerythrin-like metal-binding protein
MGISLLTCSPARARACSEGDAMNLPSRFFVWNERFELGISSVDADHQRFLSLMNDLHYALDQGESGTHIHSILKGLKAYATYHFIREEDLMGTTGYPGLPTHQVQHAWYLYYLEKLEGQAATDPGLACETMRFMRDWFLNHILGIDKTFSEWLAATNQFDAVAFAPTAGPTTAELRCSA